MLSEGYILIVSQNEKGRYPYEKSCYFRCGRPHRKEGGYVLGVNAMEAGDIRQTDAMEKAYQMGCEV